MKRIATFMVTLLVAGVSSFAETNYPGVSPNADIIAVVLGEKLTINDKDKLSGLIFGALLEQFAKENKIEPTEKELNAFILKMEERKKQHQIKFERDREKLLKELESPSLSVRDRKEKESQLETIERILKTNRQVKERTKGMEEQWRPIAQQVVRMWKINKALYAKYGGRVIFQQAGVEPIDAYRDFLKDQQKKGTFQILNKKHEVSFWEYFTNDAMHTFYSEEDGAKFINTPWWLMEEAPE
jgi:hypothetical protein